MMNLMITLVRLMDSKLVSSHVCDDECDEYGGKVDVVAVV